MSNVYFWILVALLIGAILPTQVAVNSKLAASVESPVISAFISFFVGTAALFSFILISRIPASSIFRAKDAPPIEWTGGLLGAAYVLVSILLLPKLGVALTISLIIAGQLLMSLIIDHYGLFGLPVREMNFARVIGILLVAAGAIIIRKF